MCGPIAAWIAIQGSSGTARNFDKTADAFGINGPIRSAWLTWIARSRFCKHARYWLAGDELRAGRSKTFANRETRRDLAAKIELLYRAAADREDVEDIELEHMNTAYRTPHLHNGLLVHQPYTIYAHWVLLRRLLTGALVLNRRNLHFDIDSTARAATCAASSRTSSSVVRMVLRQVRQAPDG